MPNITPYHQFNASFVDVVFSPDSHHLWLLSEQQLNAYHIEDRAQHTLWRTNEASFCKMCVVEDVDAIFVIGRRGETDLVLVELDMHSGQERRRQYDHMGELLGEERFNIFIEDDFFSCSAFKIFEHHENKHLVAHCSDECGDFILHWSDDIEIPPTLVEFSPNGMRALVQCIDTSYIVVDDFLYDLDDRCIVTAQPQKSSLLCHNSTTQQTLRYVDDCHQDLFYLTWTDTTHLKNITLERLSEGDGWDFPTDSTIAVSSDAQWFIGVDAWYDEIPEGCNDHAAHIGIWHTQTGNLHTECLTQSFTEYGGVLQIDRTQKLVCVSYDDTIELFSLHLPPQHQQWLTSSQPLDQYARALPDTLNGQWDQCPLPNDTIVALDDHNVIYTGTDQPKRAHRLPRGIS